MHVTCINLTPLSPVLVLKGRCHANRDANQGEYAESELGEDQDNLN